GGERGGDGRRRNRQRSGRTTGTLEKLAARPECQEGRAMEGEEERDRDPGEDRVGAEEVQEVAGVVAVRVERHAVEEVRERDAPDEGGPEAADGVRSPPG